MRAELSKEIADLLGPLRGLVSRDLRDVHQREHHRAAVLESEQEATAECAVRGQPPERPMIEVNARRLSPDLEFVVLPYPLERDHSREPPKEISKEIGVGVESPYRPPSR